MIYFCFEYMLLYVHVFQLFNSGTCQFIYSEDEFCVRNEAPIKFAVSYMLLKVLNMLYW